MATKVFKKFIVVLVLFAFINSTFAAETNVKTSVLDWLKIVDAENYKQSWDKASSIFQNQISSSQWSAALASARGALGKVNSREVIEVFDYSEIPNLPKGNYKVFMFATSFENKKTATEVVTVLSEKHDWLVVGYAIN